MFENIEQIKQAIDVEIKYQYIDIRGKEKTFSKFIRDEIYKEYKKNKKNTKWAVLMEFFERYPFAGVSERRKAINIFINAVKSEKNEKNKEIKMQKDLTTSVTYIKGVGPKIAYRLNKLGIFTAADLLLYFPKKHIDYSSGVRIKDLKENMKATIFGKIKSVQAFTSPKKLGIMKVRIADESGFLDLVFFFAKSNRVMLERMKSQFPLGFDIMVSGEAKINSYDGRLTLDKPQYSIGDFDFSENINLGRIVPIYPLTENLNIKILRKAVFNAINIYKPIIENVLPDFIKEEYNLLDKREAIEQMHFPTSMEKLEQARFSLVFEEFFIMQLKLAHLREQNRQNNKTIPLKIKEKGLVEKFINNLPFELTKAQNRAIKDILKDLNSKEPMQRLLQGDVGSGKTVVATIMLLAAVENGYQGAMMAPTEILATQHFNNLKEWGISAELFLGSNSKKQRDKIQADLKSGKIDIAVGTHALIQENIEFANLGAVVIDEQHRFGVQQRAKLRYKSQIPPQILTMTATPIPRSLALTLHGDLDLTVIDEMPKGRKPVITTLTSSHKDIYKLIEEQVNSGRQVYIVYPLIEESETLSAKAATIEAEKLQKEVFPQYKIGLLHGKLKKDEKDKVMSDFKNHKYNILVSTTVVEVGVDIENATLMVIENAERFGLSQLHQLRGRVGRSSVQSYCVLVSGTKNEETKERLKILTQTNDGFVISEQDLQLRGPGEFLGSRQSGLPDMAVADLLKDTKILELARNCAVNFINKYDLKDFPKLNQISNLHVTTLLDI